MFFQCTFKNVKDQISVKNYALFKLHSKIQKLTNNPIGLHLVVKQDKSHILLDCKLNMGDKTSPIVIRNISGLNFFEAIDNLSSKLERSILKKKTQKHNFRKDPYIKKRTLTNDGGSYDIELENKEYDLNPYYDDDSFDDEKDFSNDSYSNWLS